jgi:tRNA dimethylallyltransferase
MSDKPKAIVIVGPTASGKTSLAIRLAKRFGGEVVSADSRLIYKGMDIGTAKPTRSEMAGIPHHLIDLVSPARILTTAEWKRKALRAIRGILKRGRLPVIVGGTGLYVRALVDNLDIPQVPPDLRFRATLRNWPTGQICDALKKKDPAYAARIGPNPRYAIRALEVMRATGKTMTEMQRQGEPLFDFLRIGLRASKPELEARISKRVKGMIRLGLLKEVKTLVKRHDWNLPAMSGIGYREIGRHLRGEITLKDALREIVTHTRQYAKRQMTWFKKDKKIRWFRGKMRLNATIKKWLISA